MASGHVNRTQRPNTWLHRPSLRREDSPCQLGAVHTWPMATNSSFGPDVSFWGEAEVGRAAELAALVENDQGKNFELCYALCRFAVSSCAAGASIKAQRFQHDLTPQDYRSKTAVGSWRLSAWRQLSLFAAFHIASDGNVIAKETEHFPSRVRPSRIGIGSGGTATGPSVAGSMDAPLL